MCMSQTLKFVPQNMPLCHVDENPLCSQFILCLHFRRLRDVLLSLCCLSHEEDVMGRERISYVIENPDMYTYWKSHKSTLGLGNLEISEVRITERLNLLGRAIFHKIVGDLPCLLQL